MKIKKYLKSLCVLLTSVIALNVLSGGYLDNNVFAVSGITNGGTYWIVNAHSGKCLDVDNAGTQSGTNVLQWQNNNSNNQKWLVTLSPSGYYLIKPIHSSNSFLTIASISLANGTNVEITSNYTYPGVGWNIDKISPNGNYKISSIINSNYALTTSNASTSNGANVMAYTYSSGNDCNDEWIFVNTSSLDIRSVNLAVQQDQSYLQRYSNLPNEINKTIADATKPFYTRWHIEFRPTYYTLSTMKMKDCPLGYNIQCNTQNCGATCRNDSRTPNHHKNFDYNAINAWNTYGMNGNDMRLITVGGDLCHNTGSGHSTGALGWWPDGDNGMVKQNQTHLLNVRVIQHELSHAYGAEHCDGTKRCIMSGGYDDDLTYNLMSVWCAQCTYNINRMAY